MPEIGRISAYFHQLLCKTSKIFAQFRAYFCIKVWQIWRNPSKINIPIGKFDRNQSKINIPIAHFFAVLWIWPSGKFQNFIFLQIRDLCQICVHLPCLFSLKPAKIGLFSLKLNIFFTFAAKFWHIIHHFFSLSNPFFSKLDVVKSKGSTTEKSSGQHFPSLTHKIKRWVGGFVCWSTLTF